MARILMVSKPIAPPWTDSSKNLVRDLATHLNRHEAVTLCRRGDAPLDGLRCERVYGPSSGGYAPALQDNARVLLRLLGGRRHDLWHFFFAPNPRSSRACALAARARTVPTGTSSARAMRARSFGISRKPVAGSIRASSVCSAATPSLCRRARTFSRISGGIGGTAASPVVSALK